MNEPQTFNFAGFTWPRNHMILKGNAQQRLKAKREGRYYKYHSSWTQKPAPIRDNTTNGPRVFYLNADFMPGLRWQWADDVVRLNHTGWFIDSHEDQVYRGMVFRLPRSRGFVIGYSMREDHMFGVIDVEYVYGLPERAARSADSLAEHDAFEEREAQDKAEAEEREREEFEENNRAMVEKHMVQLGYW